jgi:IstB-like ATP binding protein
MPPDAIGSFEHGSTILPRRRPVMIAPGDDLDGQDDRRFQFHVSDNLTADDARIGAGSWFRDRRPLAHREGQAAALTDDLSSAFRAGQLTEALPTYTHPAVLVVDEVGYLTYGTDAANMLFHVVNERHRRRRSMIFTTKTDRRRVNAGQHLVVARHGRRRHITDLEHFRG